MIKIIIYTIIVGLLSYLFSELVFLTSSFIFIKITSNLNLSISFLIISLKILSFISYVLWFIMWFSLIYLIKKKL